MKRLIGANEQLRNIHGEGGQHRTGRPLSRAVALGDIADGQFAPAEDASKRWHAVYKLLKAAYKADAVLLEDEDHKQIEEMVVAAFLPQAMERHGYQQGGLVQLQDWLRTAGDVRVELAKGAAGRPEAGEAGAQE